MSYIDVSDTEHGFFDVGAMKEKGLDLRETYVHNSPFPHIAIDDFITPSILDACLEEFPQTSGAGSESYDRKQERLKTEFNPDRLSPRVRSFFYSLNSRPFLQFLENMTGITGLIPDPFFLGGGFHQTNQGGHLSVHADFNLHGPLKLERRLNVLIYLNKDWKEEYGGALELWDLEMKNCVRRVAPEYNRCVVFSTNATSWHGHPAPVAHPQGLPRRSLAMYYYTATWDGTSRPFTTQFKKRPKTEDVVDWQVKSEEIMTDLLPPIVMRNMRRVARRLKRAAH